MTDRDWLTGRALPKKPARQYMVFPGFRSDAAREVEILNGTFINGAVGFTRASTKTYFDATGVLQTAAVDEWPVEYDPDTGLLLGRSVWEARTNLALHSRDLTNAAWTKSSGTAAKDQVGRDGVADSASSFTATGANATVLQSITSASAARTYSVDVKRLVGTGTVEITQNNGTNWTSIALTEDWTRFEITATVTNPVIGLRVTTSGDSIEVDYNQQELGSSASPRIATTTATVTRAADTATITDLSAIGFNASEGTIVCEAIPQAVHSGVTNQHILNIGGASGENIYLRRSASDTDLEFVVLDGSAVQTLLSAGPSTLGTKYKIAATWAADHFGISIGGAAAVTDTAGTVPTVTNMKIGVFGTVDQFNGVIPSLTYLPRKTAFANLPALSA